MNEKKEKGFTLMEIVVTLLVFSLVTVAAVGMFNVSYSIQKMSNQVTKNQNDKARAVELGEEAFQAQPFEIEFELGSPGPEGNVIISSN